MKDYIGDWSLGNWRPHLEDELMSEHTDFYVGLFRTMHQADKAHCTCDACLIARNDEWMDDAICQVCDGLGQIKEYPTSLFTSKAWTWVACPACSESEQ